MHITGTNLASLTATEQAEASDVPFHHLSLPITSLTAVKAVKNKNLFVLSFLLTSDLF
jgi:hypothetical protein